MEQVLSLRGVGGERDESSVSVAFPAHFGANLVCAVSGSARLVLLLPVEPTSDAAWYFNRAAAWLRVMAIRKGV